MAKVTVERSSGNVFTDLGVPEPEGHKLKAALVTKLAHVIRGAGLNQTQAAKASGLSQPDLSRILRGCFRDVGAERLIRALRQLGYEIEIGVAHRGERDDAPILLEAMAD